MKHKIPKVVFSAIDQTSGVKGKSIKILEAAACKVTTGIRKLEGDLLVKARTVFTTFQRPYVILKYAQSKDGYLGKPQESVWLTNPVSKRLVHKWRSETDVIMVGTNTAEIDNPKLTNRLYFGSSPRRIVLDRKLRLSPENHLFDQTEPTWVITEQTAPKNQKNLDYLQFKFDEQLITNILKELFEQKVGSLIVEGGQQLLQSFIDEGYWDEARVFETPQLLHDGLKAPELGVVAHSESQILSDTLKVYYRPA